MISESLLIIFRIAIYASSIGDRPAILSRPSTAVLVAFTEAHGQSDERSRCFLSTEVARARRIDGEGERDKLCKDGRRDRDKLTIMENNAINEFGKVSYGRVQVTVPMHIKIVVLSWAKKSGMRKSEFLRTAFLIGAQQLATSVNAKSPSEDYSSKEDMLGGLRGMATPDR